MSRDTVHERIKLMMMAYATYVTHQPTSNAAFGAAVGREERVAPYSAKDVQDWLSGEILPAFSTLMAIGRVAGHGDDEKLGYLAFGKELKIHELTEDEYRSVYRGQRIAEPNNKAP